MFRNTLLCFAAGCLGALASSLVVWLLGRYGINQSLGVAIAPSLTTFWLYPRIVWGGLWGFLFLLPWLRSKALSRGLLYSLFPTLAQLLYIYPYQEYHGFLGLKLGLLTPVLVFAFNAIWGVTAAIALKLR